MSNRTVSSKLSIYSVDEILKAGGVDAFLRKSGSTPAAVGFSGILTIGAAETKRLLDQLRQQH
jgi:hypothetical protein